MNTGIGAWIQALMRRYRHQCVDTGIDAEYRHWSVDTMYSMKGHLYMHYVCIYFISLDRGWPPQT